MLERLKALFATERSGAGSAADQAEDLRLAAAALMVEAARQDGHVDPVELDAIRDLLRRRFSLSDADSEDLLAEAREAAHEATQLYAFVRSVNEAMAPEQRVEIVEMLWEVAYADGVLNDYEASLIRRVAGLLYVPDQDSGAARKRVLARLDLDGDEDE